MTVIQSGSTLLGLQPGWLNTPSGGGSLTLYSDYTEDYWTIYRTQPTVKTVVDFLARNIAQLGLHVFRRVSDTDRERLADHPLAQLLARPNPSTTTYRLIRRMVRDVCIYGNGIWLKIKPPGGGIALLAVPFEIVSVYGTLSPTGYKIGISSLPDTLSPDKVCHFREDGEPVGVSPLESLRRILAEEATSGDYREGFWRNGARMAGIIKRPSSAPEWGDPARARFSAQWAAAVTGQQNSGTTAILEDDMEWVPTAFNAEDSQYLGTRELTRTEVARAFHVPLPMVGILTHATFSNITEQHKNLYQDSLGPWLEMIQQDIELQLLPEFGDTDKVYVEFNIQAKMAGSFEEQASSLSTAVGRPWLTADEARARQNLPSLGGDAAALVTPLNVLVGGQASPQTPTGENAPKALGAPELKSVDPTHAALRARHVAKWSEVLVKFFERQREATVAKLPKGRKAAAADLFNEERWNRELAADLLPLSTATATVFAKQVADALGLEFDPAIMVPWLQKNAQFAAEGINAKTLAAISAALEEDDELEALAGVFDVAAGSRAAQISQTKVTNAANFGAHDAATHLGLKEKTWRVNSGKPRPSHARMNGSTVRIQDDFPLESMKWPGDPAGGADEVANCTCSVSFS